MHADYDSYEIHDPQGSEHHADASYCCDPGGGYAYGDPSASTGGVDGLLATGDPAVAPPIDIAYDGPALPPQLDTPPSAEITGPAIPAPAADAAPNQDPLQAPLDSSVAQPTPWDAGAGANPAPTASVPVDAGGSIVADPVYPSTADGGQDASTIPPTEPTSSSSGTVTVTIGAADHGYDFDPANAPGTASIDRIFSVLGQHESSGGYNPTVSGIENTTAEATSARGIDYLSGSPSSHDFATGTGFGQYYDTGYSG